ncbi:MAG: YggT family protein [Alphaproteobacteria bacterium]|nr:YggT family protein [Alphaproteobacteria bacterium]MBF0393832.1 YggT family protein [Alphaproteobacteria bacterium]
MELTPFFSQYWYFHIPNYALAVLIYTLLGRFLLGLMVHPDSANYIWRFFRRLTDPILRIGDWLIPRMVAAPLRPLAAAFHLFVLRLIFWIVLAQNGLAPSFGASS